MAPYARRRLVNAVVMGLSVAATGFGLLWLALVLWTLLVNGVARDHPGSLQPDDAAARQQRRAVERDLRQRRDDGARDVDRNPDRHSCRHLSRRIQPRRPLWRSRPLYQRHPVERAVDHRRALCLRDHGCAHGPFFGLGGCGRAGDHRRPGRGADHRGHAEPGAERAARGGLGAGHAEMEGDRDGLLPGGDPRAC